MEWNMKTLNVIAAASLAALLANVITAHAEVSAQEASALKTTLTPIGAERAGNAAGTIPAWVGCDGKTTEPVLGRRTDPFAGESPVLKITAKNVDEYKDKLTDGQVALFKKYPDYRMDVYTTHRTACAPNWVYDNIARNAISAKVSNGGDTLTGALGGVPFPIPKSGVEVMWNHQLRWQGDAFDFKGDAVAVTTDGKRILLSRSELKELRPYYFKEADRSKPLDQYAKQIINTSGPPLHAGEALLFELPLDFHGQSTQAWTYLPGQRRVRKLPVADYDTPNPVADGLGNVDEVFTFYGAMDRYDWKIVGKKEIYVPYNDNRELLPQHDDDVLADRYLSPDHVRWELHRVWVVDATLKSGMRHSIPHRRFYADEDSWIILLADGWDAHGQLWRTYWQLTYYVPDMPGVVVGTFGLYDLLTGAWYANGLLNEQRSQITFPKRFPADMYSPDAMAADGVQ
jgi:hypothetical protein